MGIVDAHVHLYPPEANVSPAQWARARGEHHWELLCARMRKSGHAVQGFPSVDELLRAMDAAEVERVILQGWYWEHHDTCVLQNRFFADCLRAHPTRLSACCTVNLRAGADVARNEIRWAKEAGFCGLGELSPHSQMFSVDAPEWAAVLDEAGRLGLPVLLHVTESSGKAYPGRVLTPLDDFVRMAKAHRSTNFVLAHWGARLPLDPVLGAEARALKNLWYDSAASPLLYDIEVFREMMSVVGEDRVLFGSDFPLVLYPKSQTQPSIASFVEELRGRAGLSEDEAASVMRQNALNVFGIR
jgi:uncharacterized protein